MVSTDPSPTPSINLVKPSRIYHILAGKLFDSHARKLVPNQVIVVDRDDGIILDVYDSAKFSATRSKEEGAEIIDLRHLTILPGFVDVHVHRKKPLRCRM